MQWYEVLLREIGATLAEHDASGASASAIVDSFSAQGRRLTAQRPHRLYKDILRIGFAAAFGEHGLAPSADEVEGIASSPMTMGPHPEVPDVLPWLLRALFVSVRYRSGIGPVSPEK